MARPDPHSHTDLSQPHQRHLSWEAEVDFPRRTLRAAATLRFDRGGGPVDLDSRGLEVERVTSPAGAPLPFALGAPDPILGQRLRIVLSSGVDACVVRYRTAAQASALQWLDPEQTAGGKAPFLYSQCQAIHARSVVPLQDTPRLRITYDAALTVPGELRALMAAEAVGRETWGERAVERYRMDEPIPPYLLAFAVGDLASAELGPRSRVWAEPSVVERAAHEFAGVDGMLGSAEALFGPYPWGRFDLLVLPPSFPYGGMENPRLTFLTPTLLTGDRSLVNVVAHELSHSWTGNLVTNASAEDFWLNEGFTVFAERRILEVLEGPDMVALHAAVGRQALDEAVANFKDRPELTRLRTKLEGVDPDDAFSQVPYEKGYLFLRALEDAAGRPAFDRFLRRYMDAFRFQSITTEQVLDLVRAELPGALEAVNAPRWIDGEGVPPGAPAARSSRLEEVEALGTQLPPATARSWSPWEWQVYLNHLPRPSPPELVGALEERFQLTAAPNPEVLVAWLTVAVRSGHAPAVRRAEAFLGEVGRMKYLKPLYAALIAGSGTRGLAEACARRYRKRYHVIAAAGVDSLLRKAA
ncbi:MAG TPA: M1 family metallopeptidase [Myxococcaceae bacterium]|nr:M1 family metallopeptidase [Myxococcaceae bacterium]